MNCNIIKKPFHPLMGRKGLILSWFHPPSAAIISRMHAMCMLRSGQLITWLRRVPYLLGTGWRGVLSASVYSEALSAADASSLSIARE